MRGIVGQAPISIFTYGLDLRIGDCSEEFARSHGARREDVLGMDLRYASRSDLPALSRALQGEEASFEGTVGWPESTAAQWVRERVFPLLDDEGRIIGGAAVVLERRAEPDDEGAQERVPGHDPITGLPDRRLLMDRLRMAVNQAERGSTLSVVALDIGRTKEVTATVGLLAGERLHQMVGEHLVPFIRRSDSFGCLGEDLFAIVVPGMRNVGQVVAMTSRLLSVFDGQWDVDGHQLVLSPGVGVATYPEDGTDAETLLAHAVGVAFRAAREDPSRPHLFSADRHAEARERLALEVDLRRAVEREEFVLHYQPQVVSDGETLRISGFEALLRWQHPVRGLVPPGAFVPIAEQTRLILPLGVWVLRAACRQLAEWNAAGLPRVRMSVNLSAPQLEMGDMVDHVREAVTDFDLDPSTVELELTERVAFVDEEATRRTLGGLKEIGTRIALDDYGTGYSSAYLLATMAFDTLKIDRSFVAGLHLPSREKMVTEAIIGLAHRMGLTVVAEGVETEEQLEAVTSIGADEVQGFYFSRPVPAADAELLLRDGLSRPDRPVLRTDR